MYELNPTSTGGIVNCSHPARSQWVPLGILVHALAINVEFQRSVNATFVLASFSSYDDIPVGLGCATFIEVWCNG